MASMTKKCGKTTFNRDPELMVWEYPALSLEAILFNLEAQVRKNLFWAKDPSQLHLKWLHQINLIVQPGSS